MLPAPSAFLRVGVLEPTVRSGWGLSPLQGHTRQAAGRLELRPVPLARRVGRQLGLGRPPTGSTGAHAAGRRPSGAASSAPHARGRAPRAGSGHARARQQSHRAASSAPHGRGRARRSGGPTTHRLDHGHTRQVSRLPELPPVPLTRRGRARRPGARPPTGSSRAHEARQQAPGAAPSAPHRRGRARTRPRPATHGLEQGAAPSSAPRPRRRAPPTGAGDARRRAERRPQWASGPAWYSNTSPHTAMIREMAPTTISHHWKKASPKPVSATPPATVMGQ